MLARARAHLSFMLEVMARFDRPPADVSAAFGAGPVSAKRFDGGRGLTWRAGSVILRPSDSADEAAFRSEVLEPTEQSARFRTPRPIRTASGAWVAECWKAWQMVPGEADESRVSDVLAVSVAFHETIAHLARPPFIDTKHNPWARVNRIAWGRRSPTRRFDPDVLIDCLRPV